MIDLRWLTFVTCRMSKTNLLTSVNLNSYENLTCRINKTLRVIEASDVGQVSKPVRVKRAGAGDLFKPT